MGGWASQITVSSGRDSNELPLSQTTATRFSSTNIWVERGDPDFDVGVIYLDGPLGDRVGWFGVVAPSSEELESYLVNISGYPGMPGLGKEQWFHANRIVHVTDRRIFYDVDIYGGQSGSPVWIYPTPDSEPQVIRIHAYGVGGTPDDIGLVANSAPRITPEMLSTIGMWVKADGEAVIDDGTLV